MTSSALSVRITSLPKSLLKFPPSSLPTTLPVPPENPTFAHPFTIPSDLYNALLSPNVPITVALVYASVVTYLNSVNAQRKYKPWAFSKTRLFRTLVIVHNVFLALYSAWTCLGMINALQLSLTDPRTGYGLAGMVDSVCKIHGPRGLGDAASYNSSTGLWAFTNRVIHLGADGLNPDSTDVGRIWNEGLAFYGWLFYVSKFYEVIDTFIILAKGKKSSLLQTYHHAGAMMCMWAGIRYMAAPIWMFVMVNSALHSIMYSYYTLSSLRIKVPKWFKQTLTTLQIVQFIVGASYAFAHLFIAYEIPVSVPYIYHLGDVASALSDDAASAVSVATATASAGAAAWLKKAAFRAAGREGLAENVLNEQGQIFGIDAIHAAKDFQARAETRYRDELHWVHCLDTSGQVFAILLNCMYLAPLTWLFMRFFMRAYLKRQERRRSSTASETARIAALASRDAIKGVKRQVDEVATEGAVTDDESIDAETTKEDLVAEETSVGNEVGAKSSPDVTPELKQDDSFVRVEAEPDSPTEVRSFGDDEEVVDEYGDEGNKFPGEGGGQAREEAASAGAEGKRDSQPEADHPEQDNSAGGKSYAEAVASNESESTADPGTDNALQGQEPDSTPDRPSEQTHESVTDDAPGSFPDESPSGGSRDPKPDATKETSNNAAPEVPETPAESKPEKTEEQAEAPPEETGANAGDEDGSREPEEPAPEAHEESKEPDKSAEESAKPSARTEEPGDESEKPVEQAEQPEKPSEQTEPVTEPASRTDEPGSDSAPEAEPQPQTEESSQPTADPHSGFGLFDTEVDAKKALPPVSPLEAPPESESPSARPTDEAESGAEAAEQAGKEQSTSEEDHLKEDKNEEVEESAKEEEADAKKEEDNVIEKTEIQPLSSAEEPQLEGDAAQHSTAASKDKADEATKQEEERTIENTEVEPPPSKDEPALESEGHEADENAKEPEIVEAAGKADETEKAEDAGKTDDAEETADGEKTEDPEKNDETAKQEEDKVIEKTEIEPLVSSENTAEPAHEHTSEETKQSPEEVKTNGDTHTEESEQNAESGEAEPKQKDKDGEPGDGDGSGNGNGKFSTEEELGIKMPSLS